LFFTGIFFCRYVYSHAAAGTSMPALT